MIQGGIVTVPRRHQQRVPAGSALATAAAAMSPPAPLRLSITIGCPRHRGSLLRDQPRQHVDRGPPRRERHDEVIGLVGKSSACAGTARTRHRGRP